MPNCEEMLNQSLLEADPEIFDLILKEKDRQKKGILTIISLCKHMLIIKNEFEICLCRA